MKTYCLALDLKDDPALIAEYKKYRQPLPQARPGEKWIPMEKIFEVE